MIQAKLLRQISIIQTLPCLADSKKIRVYAELSDDISEVMPYLNAIIHRAIYNPHALTLTVPRGERLITLYPRQIWMGKIHNIKDAHEILDWLKNLINQTFQNRQNIKPIYERRQQLNPLDVYKYLPGKNCGKCGIATCLAFAINLLSGKDSIMRCSPLFTSEFTEKREQLLKILQDAGYEVPSEFIKRWFKCPKN